MMNSSNPMDMCKCMMDSITTTAKMAGFATSEVQTLFEEWAGAVEGEILSIIKKDGKLNTKAISNELKISEESVLYFISKLIRDKKIEVKEIAVI